ncbi:PLP-dependent aminotransferase family protein [Jiangella muralis]|uniref:aminotransferase-like domain-containing protein n=1 Tax=Jiangella muralis TaxID=702383 RepID=UPI0014703BA4|nr:PLP-dependent aminotransferase family protein [Jiangella muralis]
MKFTADQLARMLLESGARTGPLHRRVSDGIRELVDLGELPPGALLASERDLAVALAVSRTTVVTAYQTLHQEGRLERRQGSGTRVSLPVAHHGARETVSANVLAGDHAATPFLNGPLATIDFSSAALPFLPLVADVASSVTRDDYLRLGGEHHGYHPRGLPALRERLAGWYTESGLPTTPDQILITNGAQQALEIIIAGCVQPGDGVVVEDPTYRGAIEAFDQAGCRIRPVRCDENGMDVAALARLAAAGPPRLVYAQSTVHNPTGAVLTPDRRLRLVKVASEHDAVLVEDTVLAGTVFDGPSLQPLAAIDDNARILTVGSMSKLFWGGLRLGWIRGSTRAISRLAQLKGFSDLGTSLVSQQIAARLLDHMDEAAESRRAELAVGREHLTRLLAEHLPEWTWTEPAGGPSLWVALPAADTAHFAQVALRFGVAILPGSVFSAGGLGADHTRLPYSLPHSVIAAGVYRLARAWSVYLGEGPEHVPVVSVTT